MKTDVIVSVSDKYLWCLKPFSLLFNKYWSRHQRVIVAGYTPPTFDLPSNFQFYSIAQPGYPKDKWADGFIEFFENYTGERFALLLEDYWLCRPVDIEAVDMISDFMATDPTILRVDLTGDRQFAGGAMNAGYLGRLDLVEAPGSQYQMSFQAGVWDRNNFLTVLKSLAPQQRNPWATELDGTTIVNNFGRNMRVFGTKQCPVRYANAMNNAAGKTIFYDNLTPEDVNYIRETIPQEYK